MLLPCRRVVALRLAACALALALADVAESSVADDDAPQKFVPRLDVLKTPGDVALGACSAVACDGRGRIYAFHRGPRPILCFDADGTYLRGWGDDLVKTAHGLRVDRRDHVWATDVGRHVVYEFDETGKLLRTLGTPDRPGLADDRFDRPTDVGFGPAGEIYVADGYGNSRVAKFAADGTFLASWGVRGTERGEFHLPHALLVDGRGRVLVGDRENRRIQVFDGNGKLLDVWSGYHPYGLAFDAAGRIFVADGRANRVLQLSSTGQVVASWGDEGTEPGRFGLSHMLAFDKSGRLHVAEVGGRRIQTLIPER